MKAVQIKEYGSRDVIEVIEDVPVPQLKEGQVLIEVYAASINPFDVKVRDGATKAYAPLTFPTTLGGDFSGVVSEVGEGITAYKKGDEVFGTAIVLSGGSGAFAKYASAKITSIAHKPSKASFEQAAALPLVGSSAVQALEEHIQLSANQKILIHGGAGGIGHIAIQIAKAIGAYVITTVSSGDVEFVKSLGVDEVIDYKNEKFEEKISNIDAVFDTIGGETLDRSLKVLRKGGVLVSMLEKPHEELLKKYDITAIGQATKTNTAHLTRVKELVDAGKIAVHIDKVFSLDQVKDAFAYQEDVHPKGKVILKITE